MSEETKKLITLLKFTINEKANNATAQKQISIDENKSNRANYFQGQYMAFNEVYSLLINIER